MEVKAGVEKLHIFDGMQELLAHLLFHAGVDSPEETASLSHFLLPGSPTTDSSCMIVENISLNLHLHSNCREVHPRSTSKTKDRIFDS